MSYERYESKVTTHNDGREEIHIIREKSGSGVWEFLGAITFLTMCVASVVIVSTSLHQQPQTKIIIQQESPR